MKKASIIIVAIVAIIAMAVTNPPENAHIDVLSNKQMSGTVGNFLEMGMAALFGGAEYRNYLVFSIVYINGKVVTLGIFNNVLLI